MKNNKDKENDKPAIKSFLNVFRPIRDWLNSITNSGTIDDTIGPPINETHRSSTTDTNRSSVNNTNGSPINETQEVINEIGHFSRNAQARMSLPIMRRRAYNQVARSMGFIYLQHKGETKQANLPNELTTLDTIRALFVCAFPHMLTMEFMSQPNIKIYIYSPSCNIFYELSDIEEVRHESVLRIHYSDPLLPMALTPQVSLAALSPHMLGHHPHQYNTLHRFLPGLPLQVPQPQTSSRSSLGQPIQQDHMMSQMTPNVHQMMSGPCMGPQLNQIPPPKPRRMIPASYTMHRLNSAHQS